VAIVGVSPSQNAETISCGGINNSADYYGIFSDDYAAIVSYECDGCEFNGNQFNDDTYSIYIEDDVGDIVLANQITGDGTGSDEGIYFYDVVSAHVAGNAVTGSYVGIQLWGFDDLNTISGNYVSHNEYGVYVGNDQENSGNTIQGNFANNNTYYGFYTPRDDNGANSVPDAGPNSFLHNSAFGNGTDDYYDATTSPPAGSGANDGTADYYKGNQGKTAYPAAIL
jgi:parallel beta-helix repeat protein